MVTSFQSRILPAPKAGSFRQDTHWVWCGSPILGDDGRYHLFSSRWPKSVTFLHWATASEIVRASADRPEGPYQFEEVVIGARDPEAWDGQVAHCPAITRYGDKFLLFYVGTTFSGKRPENPEEGKHFSPQWAEAWNNKRFGFAVADSVLGPWKRPDRPALLPQPGAWDSVITSNPTPCVLPDGRIMVVYKSTNVRHPTGQFPGRFHLGIAVAADIDSPFKRLTDSPLGIGQHGGNHHLEDPCIWWNGSCIELIAKDMDGEICCEPQAAIHAWSTDGIAWHLADSPKAYSRTIRWDDGSTSTVAKLERPAVLVRDGVPTHLFAATLERGLVGLPAESRNLVIPCSR
jgi:hypothetical protein